MPEIADADSQTQDTGWIVAGTCGRLEHVQIDDISLFVLHFGGFGVEVSTGDGEVEGGWFFGWLIKSGPKWFVWVM